MHPKLRFNKRKAKFAITKKEERSIMIIHIDCNSFYASVEIATRPELAGRPVVVSNNNESGGGIILALTKEAKMLGLHRGDPIFKVKKVLAANDVIMFAADLYKYRAMSKRIMQSVIEQELVLDFLQYSVDEFFGCIPEEDPLLVRQYMRQVSEVITHNCGIPVSCGCSNTYTLAKVATWFAKRYDAYDGICVITPDVWEKAMRKIAIENVWGIGRRSVPKLKQMGIVTAYDFANLSESLVCAMMTMTGVRTWRELHGIPSIEMTPSAHQQSIMHSRTFPYMITQIEQLHELLSNYAADTAMSLRNNHSLCKNVTVFLCTNPHRTDLPQYSCSDTEKLSTATANTQEIVRVALLLLDRLFVNGYKYKRMGIVLGGIIEDAGQQLNLFDRINTLENRKLMEAADRLNTKYGRNTVRLTVQGSTTTHAVSSHSNKWTTGLANIAIPDNNHHNCTGH